MTEEAKTGIGGTSEDTGGEDEQGVPLEMLRLTMDKRIDLAVDVGIALLGVVILIATRHIRAGSLADPLTSRGLPNITGVLLVFFGVVLAGLRIANWSALPGNFVPAEGGQADEEGYPASTSRYIGIVLASLIWIWLIKPLGFLIITPIFLLIAIWLMDVRSKMKLFFFPTVFTLAAWYMFSQLLGIIMPLGPLTSFARSWGLIP